MSNVLSEFQSKQPLDTLRVVGEASEQFLYSILEMKAIPEKFEEAFDYYCCNPCQYHPAKSYGGCDEVSCFKAWATGDIGLFVECLQEYNEEQVAI